MTVVSALSPLSLTCFFYDSGELVRPARLFFYKPNTEDAVTVYTDPTLGGPYGQPVLSGGSGRVPPIYIGAEPHRVRIYDTYGALIEDIEYLPGATAASEGGGGGGTAVPGTVLQTGDMFYAFATATTQRTGCVRANGGVIGPVGFDTTPYPGQAERLNADTHDLFIWLWGQDFAGALDILPNRGVGGAESDWVLNKGIRLPDLRGRTLIGIDGMGQVATGRLAGVNAFPLNYNASGVFGGDAGLVQTAAQMPYHGHNMAAAADGITISHDGTGVVVTEGAIASLNAAATGVTLNDTGHLHTYAGVITSGAGPFGLTAGSAYTYNPAITTNSNVTGNSISDPGHVHTQNAHTHPINDLGHSHTATASGHVHSITPNGASQSMQTISPFSLAVVYIKL